MTAEQMIKNLGVPLGNVDVVIDTDAQNEVDDQFAISYLLRSDEKLNTLALYAAPYSWPEKVSVEEGMEQSYHEILKLLKLAKISKPVFRGAKAYMQSDKMPVISDAVLDLCERAKNYTPDSPLYVVAIGALTNIASAILSEPCVKENCVVVWLGGHGHDYELTDEFNMRQDLHATRAVMLSGVPFIQIPCEGVANVFSISAPELREYLIGKNPLADYLASNVMNAQKNAGNEKWARVLWDVTAIAWLLNDNNRFMLSRVMPIWVPTDDFKYTVPDSEALGTYVFHIFRNVLMTDLIDKLTK